MALVNAQSAMISSLQTQLADGGRVQPQPTAPRKKSKKRAAASTPDAPTTPTASTPTAPTSAASSASTTSPEIAAAAAAAAAASAAAAAAAAHSAAISTASVTPVPSPMGPLVPCGDSSSPLAKLDGYKAGVMYLKYKSNGSRMDKLPKFSDGDAGRVRECLKWFDGMVSADELKVLGPQVPGAPVDAMGRSAIIKNLQVLCKAKLVELYQKGISKVKVRPPTPRPWRPHVAQPPPHPPQKSKKFVAANHKVPPCLKSASHELAVSAFEVQKAKLTKMQVRSPHPHHRPPRYRTRGLIGVGYRHCP